MILRNVSLFLTTIVFCSTVAFVQGHAEVGSPDSRNSSAETRSGAPDSLVILFDLGSSKVRLKDDLILDRASRAYNEGKPIVMIISGNADRSGSPQTNLSLSQKRANAVVKALIDRGIPAERFQVLAKGETELPVPTPHGVAQQENRRVVITWH